MKKLFFFIFISIVGRLSAQTQRMTVEEYIATYKDTAIDEMKRSGIPASITLAQGILETENGNSVLVLKSNNHFGIKCKTNWTGESVLHTDDAVDECFRKYASAAVSYKDHSDFLRNNGRYAQLFKLAPDDYKGWAYGLKKAGYATNPKYPNILISNIERYNLHAYDIGGKEEVFDAGLVVENDVPKQIAIAPVVITETKVLEDLAPTMPVKTLYNGLKAVHAKKGISLLAIASNAGVSLSKMLEYNDLAEDGLLKDDQWIYLERKRKVGNRDIYVAESTETLYDIAQNNAVQLQQLAEYNQLNTTSRVSRGTTVKLRPGVADQRSTAAVSNKTIHEVQPKEGLYSIAKRYNVTVEDIRKWNQLSADGLKVGQQIIIFK